MGKAKEKRTKFATDTKINKSTKFAPSAEPTNHHRFACCFGRLDINSPFSCEEQFFKDFWNVIFPQLTHFTQETWQEVLNEKRTGSQTKNHQLSDVCPAALKRLNELALIDEQDAIYSLSLTAHSRLIGIRERGAFHILWYDPDHQVYPQSK